MSRQFSQKTKQGCLYIRQARTKLTNTISMLQNHDSKEFRAAFREFYNICESFLTKECVIGLLSDSGLTPKESEKGLAQITFEVFAKSVRDSTAEVLKDQYSTEYIYARRSMCKYSRNR